MEVDDDFTQEDALEEMKAARNTVGEDELEEMREAFRLFDTNNSNTIEQHELARVMRILGLNPSDVEVEQYLKAADISGDNVVDFDEFVYIIEKNKHKINDEQLLKAFQVFDRDKNGLIDKNELKTILVDLNGDDDTTLQQVEEMILHADVNKDGCIDYRELMMYWKCK